MDADVEWYIPCFEATGKVNTTLPPEDPSSCMNFNLDNLSLQHRERLAVIAGHFEWGVWGGSTTPSIFVMIREPIARTLSLYYERVFPQWRMSFNTLGVSQVEYLMTQFYGSAYSRYRDEGMSNTACKMLCGMNYHKVREHKRHSFAKHVTWLHQGRFPNETIPDGQPSTQQSLERLSHTVVGLTERLGFPSEIEYHASILVQVGGDSAGS